MIGRLFRIHGHFCSSHPWEVIVTTLISAICVLSTAGPIVKLKLSDHYDRSKETTAKTEIVLMALAKCMALLCIYHQFKNLWKIGSKYVVIVACLFMLICSFVFCCSVVNLLGGNVSNLSEALPFFLLMIDLSKVSSLTRFALSSSSKKEVRNNLALGMAVTGPALTLDAVVETLAISIGSLSGVPSLENMSCFACLAVTVNYLTFMSFFPACLSLALELTKERNAGGRPAKENSSLSTVLLQEKEETPNPALQRVKVIMSAGLMAVHAHCRWIMVSKSEPGFGSENSGLTNDVRSTSSCNSDVESLDHFLKNYLNIEPDQLVILALTIVLVIRYMFYENCEDLNEQLAASITDKVINSPIKCDKSVKFEPNIYASSLLESTMQEKYRNNRTISFTVSDDFTNENCSTPSNVETSSVAVQTDATEAKRSEEDVVAEVIDSSRDLETCVSLYDDGKIQQLSDSEILALVKAKYIPAYKLESILNDSFRGVTIRRKLISGKITNASAIDYVPYDNYDYKKVTGACCENVIGYVPVPVGIAGPMLLDGVSYYVPMATTEGCLVASTNRGFRALLSCGGIRSSVVADGMSRAPVVRFPSAQSAARAMNWLKSNENFSVLKQSFDSTSRFARLEKIHVRVAGRYLFIRFVAKTGDAMGMNMLSKGADIALDTLKSHFGDMEVLSLSGNYCSDKKSAAVNWIEGRGKSVVCEAVVPEKVVRTVLKTSVQALIDVNISKNLIGSAIAGSIGGFNAQASNIVAAVFIATGQDPAQTVTSSNCMTLMEPAGSDGQDLYITVTMPSIEIGTVGGGTVLSAQLACLKMLGVDGSSPNNPGQNAKIFATIVCGSVLAGELSLISALASGHLVRSHMRLNRSMPVFSCTSVDESDNAKKSKDAP